VQAAWWQEKARRSRGQEPVQGSGSRPESARGVCGGSPQNRPVTWLSHKTKTGGSAGGDGIRAPRSFEAEDTRRDRKACVEAKRRVAAGHPSYGATANIPNVPLGGVYPSIM
jgi:hypothetical protein